MSALVILPGITWEMFAQIDHQRVRYGGSPARDMWEVCWSDKLQTVGYHTSWFQYLPNGAPPPRQSLAALLRLLGP